jgi:hypothetical protein
MQNTLPVRRTPALMRPTGLGMNGYEWSLAKQRMDEAMMLGDVTLRAVARVRTAMRGFGRSLRGLWSPRQAESVRAR